MKAKIPAPILILGLFAALILFAGAVTFFGAAALFLLLPINMGAFYALLGAMAVYALSWLAASLWLSKRL